MANEQNLVPFDKLTESQQREIASKGGKASVQAKQKKIILRELLEEAMKLTNAETGNTNAEDMAIAMMKEALQGNTKAFEIVRDTIGQKPKEQIEFNDVTTANVKELRDYVKTRGKGLH